MPDRQGPGVYSFVPDKVDTPFFTDENTKRPIITKDGKVVMNNKPIDPDLPTIDKPIDI